MPLLQNSSVRRAGVTARRWAHGTSRVRAFGNSDGVNIGFSISSKGGGRTEVQTTIGSDDFEEIINQMLRSDPDAALKYMSAALAEHHAGN